MSNFANESHLHSGIFKTVPNCLRNHPSGTKLLSAVSAALAALDPAVCISSQVRLEGNTWVAGPHRIELSPNSRIRIAGGGKAGLAMAGALFNLLGNRIETGAVAIQAQAEPPPATVGPIQIFPAGHPIPDEAGVRASTAVLNTAGGLGAQDLLIVPISGGASALLTLPSDGLRLSDLQTVTRHLLLSGADIASLNVIRKHLSAIKGGRLAEAAFPARVCALILSDVVGDPIEAIGSGPTAPDASTFAEARELLSRFCDVRKIPRRIRAHLQQGEEGLCKETPKPDDPIFKTVVNLVVGGNRTATQAAADNLAQNGIHPVVIPTPLTGEARNAGLHIVEAARRIRQSGTIPLPTCLIFGGETTVTVRGGGKGGRNQETTLAAVPALSELPNFGVLTFATDGQDGPTDAAGAAATHETLARGRRQGMDPVRFLNENDSHRFFEPLGDLVRTGPTGTNAADLTFVFFQ